MHHPGGEAPPLGGGPEWLGAGEVGVLLGVGGGVARALLVGFGVGETLGLGDFVLLVVTTGGWTVVEVVGGAWWYFGAGLCLIGAGRSWLAGVPATLKPIAPVSAPPAALATARTTVVRR